MHILYLSAKPFFGEGNMPTAIQSIQAPYKAVFQMTVVHLLEHKLYPKVINWFGQGRLKLKHKKAFLDGREINIKK